MDSETITAGEAVLAIVVRHVTKEGLTFFTPPDFPFQLGVHIRKKGEKAQAHKHHPFTELKNFPAQEFFYVEKGKVTVGLYHRDKEHSRVVLLSGDMIVLNCAHDVVFAEDSRMIEIKQGPYRGKDVEKRYL